MNEEKTFANKSELKDELTRLIRNYSKAEVMLELSESDKFAVTEESLNLACASKELTEFMDKWL